MEKKKILNHKQELSHSRLRKQLLLLLGLLLVLGRWRWRWLVLGLVLEMKLLMGLGVWLGLVSGLVLGLGLELLRTLINCYRQQSKTVTKRKTQLPNWVHRFLRDEEKAAILLDYRISWYGSKRPNKWIRFQVFVRTLRHIFYEVWFEERLYEIKSFQIGIPRR